MKVYKVADIVEGEIMFSEKGRSRAPDLVGILTSLKGAENPATESAWRLCIMIEPESVAPKPIWIDLPPVISTSDSADFPVFLAANGLVFWRNRLFLSERPPKSKEDSEEIILRTKKAVYDEDAELVNLRAVVANLEATIEFVKSGPRRDPIPEDVKMLVWTRDGGACVRCGARQNLQFDHIIPVVKGGGTSEANIQILCQICNLKKADKIATL